MRKTNQISNGAKKLFSIIYFGLLIVFLGAPLLSQAEQFQNPLSTNSFEALVGAISNFIFKIAIVLAPVMLIIAGFLYVTSAGDPKRITTAKTMILYTAIGLAILLLASGLIKVLESLLGVEGT